MSGKDKPLRVKAREMRPRISGFSLIPPNIEFSFPEPDPDERDIVRRLIAYLEDRRVLYAPEASEIPDHCVSSVIDMRRELTTAIGGLPEDSPTVRALRSIRAACRKFLNDFNGRDRLVIPRASYSDWVFGSALGELRGVTGVALAAIAERHALDIEPPLSGILPTAPTDTD